MAQAPALPVLGRSIRIGPVMRRPVLGTDLTIGGAIVILMAAPAFWFLFLLV